MTASIIGSLIQDLSISDELDGDRGGSFTVLVRSDSASHKTAYAECLALLEGAPYNYQLGAYVPESSSEMFAGRMIVRRSTTLVSDSDNSTFLFRYDLGSNKNKLILTAADWTFDFNSSLSTAETNIDIDGAFIEVGTLDTAEPTPTSGPPYTAVPRAGAQVQKMFPSMTITATGILPENPVTSYAPLIGKLNSASIAFGDDAPLYADIGTTMLTGASVTTIKIKDGGELGKYQVTYTFEYRENIYDWEAVVVAIDPKTGKPYQGIEHTKFSDGTIKPTGPESCPSGSLGFAIYEQADIGALIS